jgi:hypothetical protein
MPSDALPDDLETLKAMLFAERMQNERLRQIIKELQRHRFGRQAETLPEDRANGGKRCSNRGSLPAHLPRIEIVVDIDDKTCPCCQGELHRLRLEAENAMLRHQLLFTAVDDEHAGDIRLQPALDRVRRVLLAERVKGTRKTAERKRQRHILPCAVLECKAPTFVLGMPAFQQIVLQRKTGKTTGWQTAGPCNLDRLGIFLIDRNTHSAGKGNIRWNHSREEKWLIGCEPGKAQLGEGCCLPLNNQTLNNLAIALRRLAGTCLLAP